MQNQMQRAVAQFQQVARMWQAVSGPGVSWSSQARQAQVAAVGASAFSQDAVVKAAWEQVIAHCGAEDRDAAVAAGQAAVQAWQGAQ